MKKVKNQKSKFKNKRLEIEGTVPRLISRGLSPKNRSAVRYLLSLRGAQRRGNLGFSLVEVMVAAVILGLSLLTIYGLYIKTFQATSRTEIKAVATALAQERMEDLINRPFANIVLWASSSPAPPDTATFNNVTGGDTTETIVKTGTGSASDYATYQQTQTKIEIGITFTITTLISWRDDDNDGLAPSDPDPLDFKRVHITVTWPGNNTSVILDRFVSLYYRPYASSSASAEAGEFLLNSSGKFARLGSASLETYTGGNKTSKAEAQGLSATDFASGQIATIKKITDDDMGTSTPQEDHGEIKIDDVDIDEDDDLGVSPVFYKDEAESSAKVSSAATKNIIGKTGYSWHAGEFSSNDGWPDTSADWPSPPSWLMTWVQPSAIAKAELTNGMIWKYDPDQASLKLYQTGAAKSGSKSVIASGSSNDKIVARSWSEVSNINIIETSAATSGIISIEKVQARVQAQANGSASGSLTTTFLEITNLRVYKNGAYTTVAMVNEQQDITDIGALPEPITSITYNKTSSTSTNKAQAETSLVIVTASNNTLITDVTIPASTITLGSAQANVSYTTK